MAADNSTGDQVAEDVTRRTNRGGTRRTNREADSRADGEADDQKPAWLKWAKAHEHDVERPVKKGSYLSRDAADKLGLASHYEKVDQSLIVESLIRAKLWGYTVYAKRAQKDDDEGEETGFQ